MNEVKTPKRPLLYYALGVLLLLLLFNFLAVPSLQQMQIEDTDYGTFMRMAEEKTLDKVEIQSNQILFTEQDGEVIYRTGIMEDPNLAERLYESGAEFSPDIIDTSPTFLSMLLTWVLPLVIFWALGNYMYKRLLKNAGGENAMMFGMGKSNAKIYVKSSSGIRFADVAGEDEAKEALREIVDYLHDPAKYTL